MIVVEAENLEPAGGVPHDVPLEHHVIHLAPRAVAVLVAHGKEDGEAGLARLPRVFDRVPFDRHAPRVFQFQQVLDRPLLAAPLGRLGEMVVGDGDVGGNEIRHARIGPAEQQVFRCRFEIVVGDGVGTGPVPARDRLRVLTDRLDVGNVAAGDRRGGRAAHREEPAPRASHCRRDRRSGAATADRVPGRDQVGRARDERPAELHQEGRAGSTRATTARLNRRRA